MVNNMIEFLTDVPPMLLAAWGSWFLAGGVLAFWYRRATELEYAPVAAAPRTTARTKPAARQTVSSDLAPAVETTPVDETADLFEAPPVVAPVAAREKKPVGMGDPFGDLATLLDQTIAPAAAAARGPGESPILSSSGAPFRRANDESKLG